MKKTYSFLFLCISTLFIVCLLLSNITAGKLIQVFGMVLPAAVVIFPLTYILGDVFTEVYGFRTARRVIWLGFACNVIAVTVFYITLRLPYPAYWEDQGAYTAVFRSGPRILLASLVGYLFGEFFNSVVLSRLKVLTKGKWLWVRSIGSSVVGEGFDTVLFIIIAFWGVYPADVIWQMILFQFLWKMCYEILLTPLVYLAVRRIKRAENVDAYDEGEKYNPFSIK